MPKRWRHWHSETNDAVHLKCLYLHNSNSVGTYNLSLLLYKRNEIKCVLQQEHVKDINKKEQQFNIIHLKVQSKKIV